MDATDSGPDTGAGRAIRDDRGDGSAVAARGNACFPLPLLLLLLLRA
ncbi:MULTISPECIES: hypothetical protein [unclassified Microbacterium]|nr:MULTISPECIES: hypothetical protein [unclassified Microbacterium]MCR2783191.1 hypothetical protein [Microbacterium sp. zg.B96]WIM15930.1 hypothetical protein QNO11_15590 [Microbacterium sp. zg-B96]